MPQPGEYAAPDASGAQIVGSALRIIVELFKLVHIKVKVNDKLVYLLRAEVTCGLALINKLFE